jgi:hypothetical protein
LDQLTACSPITGGISRISWLIVILFLFTLSTTACFKKEPSIAEDRQPAQSSFSDANKLDMEQANQKKNGRADSIKISKIEANTVEETLYEKAIISEIASYLVF